MLPDATEKIHAHGDVKQLGAGGITPPRSIKKYSSSGSILLMDGTRVANLTCLITRTLKGVECWQYSPWESSTEWERLIYKMPTPRVVVVDGQKGSLKL